MTKLLYYNIPRTKYKINLILIINCFNIIKEVTMVTKKKVLSLIVLGLMSCMMISEVGARKHKRKAAPVLASAPVPAK